MARVSFTLRRPDAAPDLGSYLRYDDSLGERTDRDSALRSDGLQTAPLEFSESSFEAVSSTYGEVQLSWGVNIVSQEDLTESPLPSGIVLVYSDLGPPQTVASGYTLVDSSNTYSYTHSGLREGRFAYYTLFVQYKSTGGDEYYEKGASLAVLLTKNYGSTELMWKRIPRYYRFQDSNIGNYDYVASDFGLAATDMRKIGPLYRFLSIFGFEMDHVRTILEYQMTANDPSIASYEHLDVLSTQYGMGMLSSDLGSKRLRGRVEGDGLYRRSKGTPEAINFIAKSIANSDVLIDQDSGEITVYSQRVNYITVPKNGAGITTHRAAHVDEVLSPLPFSTNTSAYSGAYSLSGTNVFTPTGSGASVGYTCLALHLSSPVPVTEGDRVYFTVDNGQPGSVKWVRLVDGSGNTLGFQDAPTTVGASKAFEVSVESGASAGIWTTTYVEYLVDLSSTFTNSRLLAERNFLGSYFDGDVVRGGWLIDASSVSDYRWSGSANGSCSLFTEDYERTKHVLESLIFDALPVTEVPKYTITSFNAIPGF